MPRVQTRPEGRIDVMPLAEARNAWRDYDFVITIEDPEFSGGLRVPPELAVQVVHSFHDTAIMGRSGVRPTLDIMASILAAGRVTADSRLLIHCHQGQSRSPAAALAVIADRLGAGKEDEAVNTVLARWPASACNEDVVALADQVLGRQGKLIAAWRRADAARPKLIIPTTSKPGVIVAGG